jgi:hypothetical protein
MTVRGTAKKIGIIALAAAAMVAAFLVVKNSPIGMLIGLRFGNGQTTDMDSVDIRLSGQGGSVSLRIPKAYLDWKKNWDGGDQDFISMEASLPDMVPLTRDPRPVVKSKDRVLITLDWSYNFGIGRSIDQRVERDLSVVHSDGDLIWLRAHDFKDRQGNLRPSVDEEDYALHEKDPKVLLSCLPYKFGPDVGCHISTDITDRVRANYIIRRSELYRWKEIDSRVRALIQSFVIQ